MNSQHTSLLPITFRCAFCGYEMEALWSPNPRLPELWLSQIQKAAQACGFFALAPDGKTWRCRDCQVFPAKEAKLLSRILLRHGLLDPGMNRECWIQQALQENFTEDEIRIFKKKLLGAPPDGPPH